MRKVEKSWTVWYNVNANTGGTILPDKPEFVGVIDENY